MVLILDGNSEIGMQVWSYLGYLTCLRRFIRSRAVTNLIFFSREDLLSFIHAHHVLTYHQSGYKSLVYICKYVHIYVYIC